MRKFHSILAISTLASLFANPEIASAEVMTPDRFAECAVASALVESIIPLRSAHPDLSERIVVSGDEERSYKLYSDFYVNTYVKTRVSIEKPDDVPLYLIAMMTASATSLTQMTSAMKLLQAGEANEAADLFDGQRTVFLGCIDEVGTDISNISEPPDSSSEDSTLASPDELAGAWDLKVEKSKILDTIDVFLGVLSKEPVQCRRFGSAQKIILQLRCMENTTAVLIYGNCHFASGFSGYGDVYLRIDSEKAFVTSMDASTDGQAIGLFSGGRSIPFAKRLMGKKSLIVRVTPYNQSPITVEFPLEGLSEAIEPLRASCNW